MLPVDLLILGCVIASAAVLLIGRVARRLRQLAALVLLATGLYGIFGLFIVHRLAWYTPSRAAHVAYSEPDKEKFNEGALAAKHEVMRFLPIVFLSLVPLAFLSIRRA